MKINKLYLSVFALFLIYSSSCSKLKEQPLSFVEPSNFYNTPTQIESAFTASMSRLWSLWGGYQYPGPNWFRNDDQLRSGNLVIPNNFADGLWRIHYSSILNLNAAIAAMKRGSLGTTVPKSDYDALMGQAEFLRGWGYFVLVRGWGDIPLILDDTPDPIQNPPVRTPVAQVYEAIIKDLTSASEKLPRKWAVDKKARPTRGAALGMLAKVYLTMATAPLNKVENYAKAAAAAKTVMDEKDYVLIPDINNVFTLDTRFGPEVMFAFSSNYADIALDSKVWRNPIQGGWGDYSADRDWTDSIPETPRKRAYIFYTFNGKDYKTWPNPYPAIKKFQYDKPEDVAGGRSLVSPPIIRFADVLLVYAEAANMANGGPTQPAVDAVNLVINRANGYAPIANHPLATTSMSKADFDTLVIEERNQELCFELGDRWFDLIRKRMLRQKSYSPAIYLNFTEDDYLFPIPDNEIRMNPKITQNPGYPLPQ